MATLIVGTNTNIGKTIVSALLVQNTLNSIYIKPVQTGYPEDSDARLIHRLTGRECVSLYGFREPKSPHLAAKLEGIQVNDQTFVDILQNALKAIRLNGSVPIGLGLHEHYQSKGIANSAKVGRMFVELAGGVNSPGISGNLLSDIMRPLRMPSILVGDSLLGGISTTISSYESLMMKGYDVPFIVMFDSIGNEEIIQKHVDCRVLTIPAPPLKHDESLIDFTNLSKYIKRVDFMPVINELDRFYKMKQEEIAELKHESEKHVWWPFTQHKNVSDVMVIDSAYKNNFTVSEPASTSADSYEEKEVFDACASWWTNGLGHGNSSLSKIAAYANGRYGHVISPEAIHAPSHNLSKLLLETCGKSWAHRVFYSDDGSTAIEVALKMAFGKSKKDGKKNFQVVGINGGYHGDTIGAMSACSPNVFNEKVDWYEGRGVWLDPPVLGMKNGKWKLNFSQLGYEREFDDFDSLFKNRKECRVVYLEYIKAKIDEYAENNRWDLGALVIEPLLMGAGGMLLIDPLFQTNLIEYVRTPAPWNKHTPVPVIFDEVFVGLYRLGYPSISQLLNVNPDIGCFAKSLTGGVVPLSVTLASESVFEAFKGDTKLEALLHGHSFTAHPIGCSLALYSMKEYTKIKPYGWSVFDSEIVKGISFHPNVVRVVSIGTVLAIELKAEKSGYLSNSSVAFVKFLKEKYNIYTRPLGNVVYFMVGINSDAEDSARLLDKISHALEKYQF